MITIYKEDRKDLCKLIIEHIVNKLSEGELNIAISGGSTPKLLFSLMATKEYRNKIAWNKLRIFWVDERCVPPSDNDSNYKMTYDSLLSLVPIPKDNVFRIKGENNPEQEERRYNEVVAYELKQKDGYPLFDIVLLGIGDDGHTSSIFPTQMELLDSSKAYEVATNPYTQQIRIALTGRAILKAKEVYFLVTGENKKKILQNIVQNTKEAENYPSYFVVLNRKDCKLFTDVHIPNYTDN